MSFDCLQEVINDFEKLLKEETGYDVIIYAGENENVKEFHAHSLVLCTRSEYFYSAFNNEWAQKKDGKFIFKKPNVSPLLFGKILRYLYCGRIDLSELQGHDILILLIAVDELNIQYLIKSIQEYLIKYRDDFLQQNALGILETVYQHELFTDLWNYCLENICKEPEVLFDSDEFIGLKAHILELILKRDDLCLDEIVIWDSLVKWGLAQHPSISQDITEWSKEDMTIMEGTLHKFIPLVRLHYISSEDFLDKVYPLKELLPKDLANNIFTFYLAPSRKSNLEIYPPRHPACDSILAEPRHFAIFSSWIDKKENLHYNEKRNPYKYDLLYRASKDGDTAAVFHQKCDNKGATIVIIKFKGSEQIVGGYNPLYWDQSDNYKSTKDSFIFSFVNRTNLQTAEVGYIKNDGSTAIYCGQNYGPTFGGGHDIHCNNNSSYVNNTHSYTKIGNPTPFQPDDYEVFQVIKR